MGVEGFWQRLMQRKLVQWAAAYIAGAFALIQVLDVVAQRFGWPDRIEKLIILALAVGFFVVLVLAWYHGDRGAQRVGGTELLIIALLLAIGGGVLWGYARVPAKAPVAVAAVNPSRSPDAAQRNPGAPVPDSAAVAASSGPRIGVQGAAIPAKSVAVLPFTNESGKPDEQFFSDGLSDDLITALSQFAGLKVISRNSAFQFRDSKDSSAKIGKALGVAHLLEGSVQRAGDEVRITATLVNASDGSIVWSQRYDKPYKDLFALQDAITKAVADALKAKLLTAPGAVVQSDRPPGGNLAAYAAYIRGRSDALQGSERNLRRAITEYGKAIKLDPDYAFAYAALGLQWGRLAAEFLGGVGRQAAVDNASAAIAKALTLDPDSALAHRARAYVLLNLRMSPQRAEGEVRRALQLAPNDPGATAMLGQILAATGQMRAAVEATRKSVKTDPMNSRAYYWLSMYLTGLGQLDAAQAAIQTSIALQPRGSGNYEELTIIEILRGDAKAALVAAQQEPPGPWHDSAMALALQVGPDRTAADAALKKLVTDDPTGAGYQIAQVYALRRNPDDMFKWLDRAWANHDAGIASLLYDPLILRYQHDTRFAAFCENVGLPTTTDAVAMKL